MAAAVCLQSASSEHQVQSSWMKSEPLPFLLLLKEMMDCVVDARLDFVFLEALVKRVGGWRGLAKVEASLLLLSQFTHCALLLSSVSTLTRLSSPHPSL